MQASTVPTNGSSHSTCAASAAVDEKIEALGKAYNELDDHLDKLERSQLKSNSRIADLEKSARFQVEDRKPIAAGESTEQPSKAEPPIDETSTGLPYSTIAIELRKQQIITHALTDRLQTLENASTSSPRLHSLSTRELTLALIDRLNHGDTLSPTETSRLQSASNASLIFPTSNQVPDIPITSAPSRVGSEEEPPMKRKRGRPPRNYTASRSSSGSDIQRKCKAGRPANPDQDDQRSSGASSRLSAASGSEESFEGGTQPARSQQPLTPLQTVTIETRAVTSPTSDSIRNDTPVKGEIPETQEENVEDDMEVDEPEREAFSEPIDIPPERRSARTPKRTKPFGDVVSWKEAGLHMLGTNPLVP